jgi:hypothetical protein
MAGKTMGDSPEAVSADRLQGNRRAGRHEIRPGTIGRGATRRMSHKRLRIWAIATFSLAIAPVIVRALWQIVVIPTPGTMLVFIPLILALLGFNAALIYLTIRPEKLRSLPFSIFLIVAFTAGTVAAIAHFLRFIFTPEAHHFLSKTIANILVISCISGYFMVIYIIWLLRKKKNNGQSEI